MSSESGRALQVHRNCSQCKHWKNERALPGAPIGTPHAGDCTEQLHPLVTAISPDGTRLNQMPGGYYMLTLAVNECGRWAPRLAMLAGLTREEAQALPAQVMTLKPPEPT